MALRYSRPKSSLKDRFLRRKKIKTEIYYFSGTGNSLAVAKDLQKLLGQAEIIPVIQAAQQETVYSDADVIGIVFPCYFMDAPALIKKFVSMLKFKDGCYIFGIVTSNAQPGNSLFSINRILNQKGGLLSAGFNIDMPGIYIGLVDYSNPAREQNLRLQNEKLKIKKIAEIIKNKSIAGIEGTYSFKATLKGKIDSFIVLKVYRGDKKFWLNAQCSECGLCEKICPQKNILISEQNNRWGKIAYTVWPVFTGAPSVRSRMGARHHSVFDIIIRK